MESEEVEEVEELEEVEECIDCANLPKDKEVVLSKLTTWIDAITVKGYVDIGFEEEIITEIT